MRKKFRKIALGLSLAMMISSMTSIVQTTYAADTQYVVTLGTPTCKEITEKTLEIGKRIDLNFYGVKDWTRNQKNYKCKWTATGDAVIVNNWGVVVAVKEGTAKVTLTITDKNTGISHNVIPVTITVVENVAALPTTTPLPTATPAPIVTPTPELELVKYNTFLLDADISCKRDDGGVILVKKNELWGALDYTGKEILPPKYSICCAGPSEEGYFCLSDGVNAYIFDKTGNTVVDFQYRNEEMNVYGVYINEGVATVALNYNEYGDDFVNYAINLETKQMIVMEDFEGTFINRGLTAIRNGKFYFSVDNRMYACDKNGQVTLVYKNPFNDGLPGGMVYYMTTPAKEYGVVSVQNDLATKKRLGVMSVDGKDLCLVDFGHLEEVIGEKLTSFSVVALREGGTQIANVGKKMVIYFYDAEGTKTSCYLLDFEKAEYSYNDVIAPWGYNFGIEKLVSNPGDIIIAQYDEIVLSPNGVHYVCQDGKYFYIDGSGKVLATYKDCCPFYNGYAAVIDENGEAYIINTKLERVSEIFEAESVITSGNAHVFNNGEQNQIVIITE